MPRPLLGQQNALHIRMSAEGDAEHIENLALQPIRGGPNLHKTSRCFPVRQRNLQPQPRVVRKRIENGHQIKTLLASWPIHSRVVLQEIELLDVARVARDFRQLRRGNDQVRLLAVFDSVQNRWAKSLPVALRQIVVQRNLHNCRRLRRRRRGPGGCGGLCGWRWSSLGARGRNEGRRRSASTIWLGTFRRFGWLRLVWHGPWDHSAAKRGSSEFQEAPNYSPEDDRNQGRAQKEGAKRANHSAGGHTHPRSGNQQDRSLRF